MEWIRYHPKVSAAVAAVVSLFVIVFVWIQIAPDDNAGPSGPRPCPTRFLQVSESRANGGPSSARRSLVAWTPRYNSGEGRVSPRQVLDVPRAREADLAGCDEGRAMDVELRYCAM